MRPTDFSLSRSLCEDLLVAQGEDREALARLPDEDFAITAWEGGDRVVGCVVDGGYVKQYAAANVGTELPARVELARMEGSWIEERLLGSIANDCGVDPAEGRSLIVRMVDEFRAYAVTNPVKGDFGVANADAGSIWIELAPLAPQDVYEAWPEATHTLKTSE